MANPDFREFDTELGNKGKKFRPKSVGSVGFVEKTANWPGLAGPPGPNRSAGVKKLKVNPKSVGL